MAWRHLRAAALGDSTLDLYGDGSGQFMIRANGLELMSSLAHASEDLLGEMAAEAAAAGARVLIGGLGLGHTAERFASLRPDARITVAEISPEVIAWYREIVAPARDLTAAPAFTIACGDVGALLTPTAWDVIALDVDNGPAAFTVAANGALYSEAGLRRLRAALAEGGTALIWSGFSDVAFAKRAEAAGFATRCRAISVPQNPRAEHYVYELRRP